MTQLPMAEHQTHALDRRKRELARAGLDPAEVNRDLVIPRLQELDWTSFLPETLDLRKWLITLISAKSGKLSQDSLSACSREGLGYDPVIRTREMDGITPEHPSVSPALIARKLERFFEWSSSPAFEDMQPILQLSLTQLRLLELLPFQEHSRILGFWFGTLPLLQRGYLLPGYNEKNLEEFPAALRKGFDFETTPLVGLNLDAALRSYEAVLGS